MPNGTEPGVQNPPAINEIAEGVAAQLFSAQNLTRLSRGLGAAAIETIQVVAGAFLGLMGFFGAELARALVNAESWAEPAYRRLAETAVEDITGERINIGSGGPGGRGSRNAAHRTIGSAMLRLVSGGTFSRGGGGPVEPSIEPAERMIEALVTMKMEGWLQDLIGELVTFGAVEQLGDLDDRLSEGIGLSRLARIGLRPITTATVANPAEWYVNKLYRPTMLSPSVAVQQFLRGKWSQAQLEEELARQGYSSERSEALVNASKKFLSPAELSDAMDLELMTYEEAVQHMRDQGYDLETGSLRVRLQQAQQVLREEDELAAAAVAAYAARKISLAEFRRALDSASIRGIKRGRVERVAELRRVLNTRDLSEGQLEEAVKRGVLSVIDYRAGLQRLGYEPDAVATLELMLRAELRTRDEAERARRARDEELAEEKRQRRVEAEKRRKEIEDERAVTEPSLAQTERAVVRGFLSEGDYDAFLGAEKYDAPTRAFLLALVRQAREEYLEDQEKRTELERRARQRELSLSQLEAGVAGGFLSVEEYGGILRARGFTAGDVDLLMRILRDTLEELEDARRRRDGAEKQLAARGLSLADAEEAVLRGIGTLADYDAWLRAQRFPEFDRAVLGRLLELKKVEYDAQRERRNEAEALARNRGVPLDDLERAVLADTRPISDYETALFKAGFAPEAVHTMVELLALEKRARDEARRKREEAERRAEDRGLSLADLARAVKWSVMSMTEYRAQLTELGYRGADQDIIVETLVREIQAQRAAEKRRRELEAEAAIRQVSLVQFARAVIAGRRTIGQYAQFLESLGYLDVDRELLIGLLEDELAEVERQRRERERVGDVLKSRDLSLGQFEAAVKANIRTIDEYGAFLSQQGFDATARATLVALLARELQDVEAARRRRLELEAEDPTRQLTLGQSEQLVTQGLRTRAEHVAWLLAQGYAEDDAALLALLLDTKVTAAALKAQKDENA